MTNLYTSVLRIPLEVRYILRLVYMKAQPELNGEKQWNDDKIKVTMDEVQRFVYIFGDLISSTWLSNAFKWPECFGLQPVLKEEALLQAHFM